MSDTPEPEILWQSRPVLGTLLVKESCPKIVSLLNLFEESDPWNERDVALVPSTTIPRPYRDLLVHARDMTSTLTDFHGEPIALRVLDVLARGDTLARHVILKGARSHRPVEYGAIEIDLTTLDPATREKVVQGKLPLGGILNDHRFCYKSCPGAFFRVRPNRRIMRELEASPDAVLYGRCNCLSDANGRAIAEVVEIVPPEDEIRSINP